VAIFAATGVILSAAYMLYMYRRIIFGKLVKPSLMAIQDLSLREIAILGPLVAATLVMGIYPNFVFKVTSASVVHLIEQNKVALVADHASAAMREAKR
jgi:NADH-quinone oxidoreductase subunit M